MGARLSWLDIADRSGGVVTALTIFLLKDAEALSLRGKRHHSGAARRWHRACRNSACADEDRYQLRTATHDLLSFDLPQLVDAQGADEIPAKVTAHLPLIGRRVHDDEGRQAGTRATGDSRLRGMSNRTRRHSHVGWRKKVDSCPFTRGEVPTMAVGAPTPTTAVAAVAVPTPTTAAARRSPGRQRPEGQKSRSAVRRSHD
jgi:hypothetical protein